MKRSGLFVASVAAASATAVAASSSSSHSSSPHRLPRQDLVSSDREQIGRESAAEKFAPRFDGLRFIETLVTAHR